jgi:hypothetical protein
MRVFKFKLGDSNIGKLYHYFLYKNPNYRPKLEYDEIGRFIMFKKNEKITIFYYIRNNGDLYYNVYEGRVAKIDKPIIKNFKDNSYTDERLKSIGDKLLKPFVI